ncbi:MAG: hypothetical protein ACR2PL_25735 [Dehalococcoidia bacterium]
MQMDERALPRAEHDAIGANTAMTYDIYDIETANLVRSFPTEEAALAMVRRAVERSGAEAVEAWALSRTDLAGEVSIGKDLVKRVLQAPV